MARSIFSFTIDSQDPERIVPFWCGVLDVQVTSRPGDGQFVRLTPTGDGLTLLLQPVPEPKVGKNRAHVDILVDDLDQGTSQVEALGGRWIEPGNTLEVGGFRWRCMADPEGNEFCILPSPRLELTPSDVPI
jgi:predicted enzyme related to lactoylglutathione lyase